MTLPARFRKTKRGAGFWVSQFATPPDLSSWLKTRGYRCQKHFPVMLEPAGNPAAV